MAGANTRDALVRSLEAAFGLGAAACSPAANDDDVVAALFEALSAPPAPAPVPTPQAAGPAPAAVPVELAELRARCAALEASTARANREMMASRQAVARADGVRSACQGEAIRERELRFAAERSLRIADSLSGGAEGVVRAAEQARDAAQRGARVGAEAVRAVPRLTRRAVGSRNHIKKALRAVHPDKRAGAACAACAACAPLLDAVAAELTQALALCNAVKDIVGPPAWRHAQQALTR